MSTLGKYRRVRVKRVILYNQPLESPLIKSHSL
jgi:hypothetical protein